MKLPCELKIYDKKLNLYIPNNYEYIKSIHFNTLGQIDIYVNGKRFFNDMQNKPTPEERP